MARKYQRQYHLVVLMLVLLCVAVLCGYIQCVLRENSIREFIINQGGYVAFRKRNASVVERLILECFSKRPIAIYGIRIDKETENIAEVLKLAQKIEHLTRIDFADSHVSDEDLSALPFLSTVNYVSLQNCKVSSVGASHLVRTPKLTVLSLQNTDVREVHFLEDIKSLRTLSLRSTKVDWRSIATISRLKWLEELDLNNTMLDNLTVVDELQEALPTCKINTSVQREK